MNCAKVMKVKGKGSNTDFKLYEFLWEVTYFVICW